MQSYTHFNFKNQNLLLTVERSIFWEEEKILILSDLHLGKSGHFRKSGIGIPQTVFKEDIQRLLSLVQFYKPRQLLVVGDLFHSTDNKEHELFLKWRKEFPALSFLLVKGNHDILSHKWYQSAGIDVYEDKLSIACFSFTHDISTCETGNGHYCFSGHIHPGIVLTGKGKQHIRLPCYYFGKKYAVLPAFGKFTGTYPVKPVKGDTVFAIGDGRLMRI